eukprot:scaffold180954_cov21-Tisochrysis_lutea.AAC.1
MPCDSQPVPGAERPRWTGLYVDNLYGFRIADNFQTVVRRPTRGVAHTEIMHMESELRGTSPPSPSSLPGHHHTSRVVVRLRSPIPDGL